MPSHARRRPNTAAMHRPHTYRPLPRKVSTDWAEQQKGNVWVCRMKRNQERAGTSCTHHKQSHISETLSCNIQPSRRAATGQTPSCHSEPRVWGPPKALASDVAGRNVQPNAGAPLLSCSWLDHVTGVPISGTPGALETALCSASRGQPGKPRGFVG
jgi:hypothetical protein